MKSTKDEKELIRIGQTGVEGFSRRFIKFVGIMEILGSIGIIIPWLFRLVVVLTPVVAICFSVIMIFASIIHFRRGEAKTAFGNLLISLIAVGVAIGRMVQIKNDPIF